jgi:hypothetical protein
MAGAAPVNRQAADRQAADRQIAAVSWVKRMGEGLALQR